MLRVGVIGCGRVARAVHLPTLARLPGVRVSALAETHPARLEAAGARFPEADRYDDFRAMLARADLEAVVVTLPPALHRDAAVAAFEAGRHVYLEKPIATTREQAEEVLRAWRRAGTVGMIGFNYRFHPAFRAGRETIRAGRIGEPVAARTLFSSAARPLPAWKRERRTGGGALLDLASHHVDLLPFLLDRAPREVSASIGSRASEGDTALLRLELEGGVSVQSLFCFGTADADRIEVQGTDGELRIDRYRGRVEVRPAAFEYGRLAQATAAVRDLARGLRESLGPRGDPSYRCALAAFSEAVRRGDVAEPGLEAGARALSVVLAAEEAARTGRTVPLAGAER